MILINCYLIAKVYIILMNTALKTPQILNSICNKYLLQRVLISVTESAPGKFSENKPNRPVLQLKQWCETICYTDTSSNHNGLVVISDSFFNWQDKVRNPALLNTFVEEV